MLPPNIRSSISCCNNLINLHLGLAARVVIEDLTWEEAEMVELGLWTLPYYMFCLYKLFTDVGSLVMKALPFIYFYRLVNAIDLCYVVCLFSWRYNPLWLYFPQPGRGL